VKPHQIIITCADANFVLTGLKWSHWGRKSATGTGSAKINDCKPFCAKGHFHKYRARIKLSSAHFCRKEGVTQFRRLRLTWVGATPPNTLGTISSPIACPSTLQP
jgi:hypothetical protein